MTNALDQDRNGGDLKVTPNGDWCINSAKDLDADVEAAVKAFKTNPTGKFVIDLSRVAELDTAGAFLLAQAENELHEEGYDVEWTGVDKRRSVLVERVRKGLQGEKLPPPPKESSYLEEIGESVLIVAADVRRFLKMLGAIVLQFSWRLFGQRPFRVPAIITQMERAGLKAVPIVTLMSFLIGGIIAQQSAFQLRFFGAELFAVDLVGLLGLREIGIILTAIMVAGRSGSAITAEIGAMNMREEIDAMRVMGLDPINVLVLPRVLALIIVLPMLTFLANISLLAGGMMTLWLYSGISPDIFITQLHSAIDFSTLYIGLSKAPFMALIIAVIACTEGMAVRGSAESLGQHTTASVVKSIFMVIVVDGVFAIFFAAIGL